MAKPPAPFTASANAYARDVIAGKIPACQHVVNACRRHERDMESQKSKAWPYTYDEKKAERVCRFMEMLPHVKGKWARAGANGPGLLKLEGWQCFIICSIFGWVKKTDGKRRFRKASIYVPRKNAKSTTASGFAWWMFAKDGEPGAEVYSGATTEKQAWEVFGPARQMAIVQPEMPEGLGVTVNAASMVRLSDASKFEPIIGKPGDGASPHCAIVDEYHEHATSELHDTMITGMGAREQPLLLIISTAGSNLAGPCRDDWKDCEKILEGTYTDETHFCIIYTVDAGDDWTSELALRKANPNYDVSISREFLLAQLEVAKRDPRAQSTFKTKHLNMWVTAKSGFFNLQRWSELANPTLRLEDFEHRECFLAGDFASKHDIAALMLLFPLENGAYAAFGRYYLPRATVDLPENQHYRAWEIAGRITATEGNVTDVLRLVDDAAEYARRFQVIEMPFDPNRAWGLSTQLQNAGVPVIEYRNTVLTMSEPMKQLDALIRAGKIIHDGDPVLSWAISNVVSRTDRKDNVFPDKERAENKIDPVVGLIMAVGRAMLRVNTGGGGVDFGD